MLVLHASIKVGEECKRRAEDSDSGKNRGLDIRSHGHITLSGPAETQQALQQREKDEERSARGVGCGRKSVSDDRGGSPALRLLSSVIIYYCAYYHTWVLITMLIVLHQAL